MGKKLCKPCRECPFRRASAPGYLGAHSNDPEGFLLAYWHGMAKPPCHMTVNYEQDDSKVFKDIEAAPVCFGFATLCKNSANLPRIPEVADAVRGVEVNRKDFFSNVQEFVEHHG